MLSFYGRRILEDIIKNHRQACLAHDADMSDLQIEKDFLHLVSSAIHNDEELFDKFYDRIENPPK